MISNDIWHKYYEWYFKIVIGLLYVISGAVRRVKFETIWKYHEWYLCEISRTNHACLYNYPQKVVIFTCRYFKLSWNTTALSQSNCRNFSCSNINAINYAKSKEKILTSLLTATTMNMNSKYCKPSP